MEVYISKSQPFIFIYVLRSSLLSAFSLRCLFKGTELLKAGVQIFKTKSSFQEDVLASKKDCYIDLAKKESL